MRWLMMIDDDCFLLKITRSQQNDGYALPKKNTEQWLWIAPKRLRSLETLAFPEELPAHPRAMSRCKRHCPNWSDAGGMRDGRKMMAYCPIQIPEYDNIAVIVHHIVCCSMFFLDRIDEQMMHFVQSLLQFRANQRPSAGEALSHSAMLWGCYSCMMLYVGSPRKWTILNIQLTQ